MMDIPYCSVSDICTSYHLSKDDFLDIFLRENVKLCIYLKNLKTYYFDFTLVDYELKQSHVQIEFVSGLFYLTTYEACKVLHRGEAFISRIRPSGEMFISLAHPQKIVFDDLLVDANGIKLLKNQSVGAEKTLLSA